MKALCDVLDPLLRAIGSAPTPDHPSHEYRLASAEVELLARSACSLVTGAMDCESRGAVRLAVADAMAERTIAALTGRVDRVRATPVGRRAALLRRGSMSAEVSGQRAHFEWMRAVFGRGDDFDVVAAAAAELDVLGWAIDGIQTEAVLNGTAAISSS